MPLGSTRRYAFAVAAAWACTAAHADEPAKAPVLTDETYAALRAEILPCESECAFEAVGWRPSFWDAVAEARTSGKPVFLWAMNGHPLGCT